MAHYIFGMVKANMIQSKRFWECRNDVTLSDVTIPETLGPYHKWSKIIAISVMPFRMTVPEMQENRLDCTESAAIPFGIAAKNLPYCGTITNIPGGFWNPVITGC